MHVTQRCEEYFWCVQQKQSLEKIVGGDCFPREGEWGERASERDGVCR